MAWMAKYRPISSTTAKVMTLIMVCLLTHLCKIAPMIKEPTAATATVNFHQPGAFKTDSDSNKPTMRNLKTSKKVFPTPSRCFSVRTIKKENITPL